MSRWLHWFNNRKQSFCLLNTIYSTYVERLDYYTRQLRKESDESNEHEQSSKPSKSVESTSTTTTCARTSGRAATRATATGSTTSSRSSTTGSSKGRSSSSTGSTTSNSLVRKHKYTTITTSRECANDYLAREYAEYLASTSAGREDVSTRVWASNEPRDFKQADANSGDSIERCIGIPAGVTV